MRASCPCSALRGPGEPQDQDKKEQEKKGQTGKPAPGIGSPRRPSARPEGRRVGRGGQPGTVPLRLRGDTSSPDDVAAVNPAAALPAEFLH